MDGEFSLDLSLEERRKLLGLIKDSIVGGFDGLRKENSLSLPEGGALLRKDLGAFVTLRKGGRLRGCIGRILGGPPLYMTVAGMARAAAFQDQRFPPLQREELPELEYELSVLGPVTPCRAPGLISIGRHGLIMKQGLRQGLLLPQVPLEWGWDREAFLRNTCVKAGLPQEQWKEAWREGGDTELYWFEAAIFTDE